MFKISRRMDYAVRIMLQLGMAGMDVRVMSDLLSKQSGVPAAFLRKIIADLGKAQLVRSYAGPTGGITLARQPQEITVLDIYQAVEGPVCLNMCLLDPALCARSATCSSLDFWDHLQRMIMKELEDATLDTLLDQALALRLNPRHG